MIRLVPIEETLLAAIASPRLFRRSVGAELGERVEIVREVVERTLDLARRVGSTRPWTGYLVVDEEGIVVGSGGFKGNPGAGGEVEIAYFTFPDLEGRGIANATARELVEIAEGSGQVRVILAHTLPERNASCRILERNGFALVGEVIDPEDGPVWRWRRPVGTGDLEARRHVVRHLLASLAYRAGKALRGAPPAFDAFRAGEGLRTPGEIVAHLGDLLVWALGLASGDRRGSNTEPLAWVENVVRFFASLGELDAFFAGSSPLACSPESLLQGPVADALTHVGQLAMLRRLAGSPIRGESYFRADIVPGRVGAEQAAPRRELD